MADDQAAQAVAGLRIRFVDDDEGALTVLELEVSRAEPVVADVHQALFAIGVQISGLSVAVGADSVVERMQLSEADGSRLAAERHLEVQTAVMEVVQRRLVESVRPGLVSAREPGRSRLARAVS